MSKTEGWLFQGALLSGMLSLASVMFDYLIVARVFLGMMFLMILVGIVFGILKNP